MKMLKKIVCGMLAGVLSVSLLTGCGAKSLDGTQTVLSVGDTDISLGTFTSLLRYQQAITYDYYQNMAASYAAYGLSADFSTLWDADLTENNTTTDTEEDGWSSGLTVKTYADQLLDNVATTLASYVVVAQHAEDYGVSLSSDDEDTIAQVAKAFVDESDEKVLSLNGITEESVIECLTWYTLYCRVYDAYEAASDITVSDEEAQSMTVSYLRFTIDESSEDYATEDAVKEQAAASLVEVLADTDMDFTAYAEDYSNVYANTESMAVNSENEDDYIFSLDDVKTLSALENGSVYTELLNDDSGNYYIIRMDNNHDEEATESYRKTLLSEKILDAFHEQMDAWAEELGVTYDVAVLSKVSVSDNIMYTGTKATTDDEDVNAAVETESTSDTEDTANIDTE